jgi:hypothetical protein
MPLSAATYANIVMALLFQFIPAILIVTSGIDWLQSRAVVWAALLIIVTAPDAQEVWLSAIGSQFYLALAVAIILGLEPRKRLVGALQYAVLVLAPLSAPACWLMAPLFVLRAAIDRSWTRLVQAAVLSGGVAIQLAFFFTHNPARHLGIPPSLLGGILLKKHVIAPFLAPFYGSLAHWPSFDGLASSFTESGGPIWPLLLVALLFLTALGAFILRPRQSPLWFLLAGALATVSGYAGALGPKVWNLTTMSGGRYAFASQILFGLALLSWSVIHQGRGRLFARAAVVWIILIGLSDYFPAKQFHVQGGPPWPDEFAKWRQDPAYKPKIWPPDWSMEMPPR